jgi:hypothetical protein
LREDLGHVFLLIDGLDEYDGDPGDTVKLLQSVISPMVKICLSSRPLQTFEDAFQKVKKLRLQCLTYRDIQLYVNENLLGSEKMKHLCDMEPIQGPKLVQEIVERADGVCLWVKLVVRSLLISLTNGDRLSYLRKRLEQIPSEIDSLYRYMLNKVDRIYFEEASRIFSVVELALSNLSRNELCAIRLSFAIEEDGDLAVSAPFKVMTEPEIVRRVARLDIRLKVCCAGLLEFSDVASGQHEKVRLEGFGNRKVQYIHRTVKDFLESNNAQQVPLVKHRSHTANAATMLMKANLLYLKSSYDLEGGRYPREFYSLIRNTMSLARVAERETGHDEAGVLDELDRTMHHVLKSPINWSYLSSELGKDSETNMWHNDFISLAVEW